ncbi:hypothetical protein IQ266_18960 [filamentous cyanobacterium LEGE 11480]|uniref:Uncharacterized protein n=2 Tax=Romeriopsis TaxID=2992131 RepID=A0A928Z4J0_9CYAN|nr:hypothetical protein [Romeriopsis navalis LEGE 11480]
MAKTPPVMLGEDSLGFKRLVKQLAEHLNPSGPTENLTVQQIAMCHLRQQRLWQFGAADHDHDCLTRVRKAKYPDVLIKKSALGDDGTTLFVDVTEDRAEYLAKIIERLEGCIEECTAFQNCDDLLEEDSYDREELDGSIRWWMGKEFTTAIQNVAIDLKIVLEREQPARASVNARLESVKTAAKQELMRFKAEQSELAKVDAALNELQAQIQRVDEQRENLMDTYQSRINRDLDNAYDRLFRLQRERSAIPTTAVTVL